MDGWIYYSAMKGFGNSKSELSTRTCHFEAEREKERREGYGDEDSIRGRREGGVICTLSYLYDRQCFPTGRPPDVRALCCVAVRSGVFAGVGR